MSFKKEWDAFVLYLDEHPGAFDKQERLGIKWADLEIKRLRKIEEAWPIFMGLYESLLRTEKRMGCKLAPTPIRKFMDFMGHEHKPAGSKRG